MIQIDFQGGAHGNYLEFVCNTMCGVTGNVLPFNSAGASHSKQYIGKKVFYADHYSYQGKDLGEKVVSIQITNNDLLPLLQISLLRAGDYGYDNNNLEVDTYNKLNNSDYRWVLDKLIDGFFKDQIQQSYNNHPGATLRLADALLSQSLGEIVENPELYLVEDPKVLSEIIYDLKLFAESIEFKSGIECNTRR